MDYTDVANQQLFKGRDIGSVRYPNPFFGIPLQFLPQNLDDQLWWADQFLIRFGFYKSALQRVADYFVTELNIESEDMETVEEYKDIFELINWKSALREAGLNLLGFGNSYVSVQQGFNRFLNCIHCKRFTLIQRFDDFEFNSGEYTAKCKGCGKKDKHRLIDKPITDSSKITITHWNPREIKVMHDDASNSSEYFWNIPEAYRRKVMQKGNKFHPKVTPKIIFDAIKGDKMVQFGSRNFMHLKLPAPITMKTDGRAIPPSMYQFDQFFMLKVVERYNEVICYNDINPFRVISMASNTSPSNPILNNQDGGVWAAAVDQMINANRKDPGSYHKFPFTFEYNHLGADAKNTAPVELMQMMQQNILMSMNIPEELFAMRLQSQAVGPGLRLFENSWSCLIDSYNKLLQMMADTVGKIKGFPSVKVKLVPITFSDDMERKSVIGQLVSSNSIARSEFLNLYGYDYRDQVKKRMEEDRITAEIQEEEQKKNQIQQMRSTSLFNQGGGGMGSQQGGGAAAQGGSPNDVLQQAQEIAEQLQPMSGAERREKLQEIKAHNETLWHAAKGALEQLDRGVQSNALAQSKGQQQ